MLFPPHPPIPKDEQRDQERSYHREVLHDLVRLGLNTAKALERRAVDAAMEGNGAVVEAAVAFERVARAIRRTILLAEKLAQPDCDRSPAASRPNEIRPSSNAPNAATPQRPESIAVEARPETDPSEEQTDDARPDPQETPDAEDSIDDEYPDHRPVASQIADLRSDLIRNHHPITPQTPGRTRPTPPTARNLPLRPKHVFVGPPPKPRPAPPAKKPNTKPRKPPA